MNLNKTILFLINGLGIEKKDSCDIYNSSTMPNLEKIIHNSFFTKIYSEAKDYYMGYQLFSTDNKNIPEYRFIDDIIYNNKFMENNIISSLSNNIKNNLHIIINLNNYTVVKHLMEFLKIIKLDNSKKIIIHFCLNQEDISEYKNIVKNINYIKYSNIKNLELGIVFGSKLMTRDTNLTDLNYIFQNCSLELWENVEIKFNSMEKSKTLPCNSEAFYINKNTNVVDNDTILIFNHEKYKYDNLINALLITTKTNPKKLNLNFYSLFPLDTKLNITSFYKNIKSEKCFYNDINNSKISTLILTSKNNYSIVEYMLSGMSNEKNNLVNYIIYDGDKQINIENLLLNSNSQFIIFDYRIDNLNTIDEVKEKMIGIDKLIGIISNICKNRYSLIITSLFGMKKELPVNNKSKEKKLIDFSDNVPLILCDPRYNRQYYLAGGFLNEIIYTSLFLINPNLKVKSLFRKKGLIQKYFVK